ncbi:ADP-ribosylglycohydrolase family protein [Dactylosporangium sp. CA-139114]|uniref:ADP-ribosylglycohydrolase family protein n=1 Tax=Dactylosporangium sp. CA-139114 TaxID=3239931 RepID=UPI003D9564A3
MTVLPADHAERVYAGVLGKIIAVYLGRPYEGWTFDRIQAELGDITYYVNDRADVALKHHLFLVTDDDISGTFVFPRALRAAGPDPSSADVGDTWLDQIVPDTSVLWWGGLGNSTEHTAYLRMRAGIRPPESGSIARNGQVVAEQVGAQIFVEGFALTCPGDPAGAADLAERAARVSHDGEAIHAARVVAALVAGAFTATDMDALLDTAIALAPPDCLIARVHRDVRGWARDGDWKATRARIDEEYGYHRYGGNCHVVPNHAIVVAALAHSGGDFDRAMTVVCTSGWDTDSNAGNVGAICGVFGGLAGLSRQDWRGPVADRMYLPAADGGGCVTDAAREALALVDAGRARTGQPPLAPGPRFGFALPGSVHGFRAEDGRTGVANHGDGLAIAGAATVLTPTFIPPEARDMPIYALVASPSLYSGQTIVAHGDGPARLVLSYYTGADEVRTIEGPPFVDGTAEWTVPDLGGRPVVAVGLRTEGPATLKDLDWSGAPSVTLTRPDDGGTMWRRAWVPALDRFDARWPEPFRIVQNAGTGMLVTGALEWRDYTVTADVTPHLAAAAGLAARVQGLRRYYALELAGPDTARLVCGDTVLAERPFPWTYGTTYHLTLTVTGDRIRAGIDGDTLFDLEDGSLSAGGVALRVTEGRTATQRVEITPTPPNEVSS